MLARILINTFSILTAVTIVNASGMIAQVKDATDFCVFLPPKDSTDRIISNTEWNANAFCMGNTPLAVGADKMPEGFIKSAHYVKTDLYVQVTGQIDYTKANLVGTDEGGQMDVKAPMGSSCAGWQYYVNLIEPVSNTYCMRCCNDPKSCNRGISEKGCAHIIPGDYSGPNDGTGSGMSNNNPSNTATTTTSNPTTTTAPAPSNTTTTTTTAAAAITSGVTSAPAPSSSNVASGSNQPPPSVPHISSSGSSNTSSNANNGVVSEQSLSKASALYSSSSATLALAFTLFMFLWVM